MANILVSGLINTETTVRVRQFPVNYYPIDYPFFGVNTAVSGVAYNISKALKTLGDDVTLLTMTGRDFPAEYIQSQLCTAGIGTDWVRPRLKETPNSVVLYDGEGKRQIYCDLKDIQETPYDFPEDICRDADVVAACNINFNRPLLHQAKTRGKTVATDVHVLSDIHDEFNREFMSCADILFLSDEGIRGDYRDFLRALGDTYGNRIIVLGRGAEGAAMYLREENRIFALPAVQVGEIVNTVGAGDALFSGFLHHFARGYRPLDALARAQVLRPQRYVSAARPTASLRKRKWNRSAGSTRGEWNITRYKKPRQHMKVLPQSSSLQNVFQTHLQNGLHMVVSQRVEDVLPLPAKFDQVHLLQNPKLVGNGALADVHSLRNVRHAQLLSGQKRQNMHPGRIGKALE